MKPDACACGAPARHFCAEGRRRSKAVTRFCCACYDREMSRVASMGGVCACGHAVFMHDEEGCRIEYCACTLHLRGSVLVNE